MSASETERGGFAPVPRRRRGVEWALALGALLAAGPAASPARASQEAVPQYRVDVGAVAVDVLVTDRKGRFVKGLKADDFVVLERGVPQELSFFRAGRTPVTVVVLLDGSASVRSKLLSVQKAANRFVDKLEKGDRARIGFFHERVVFGPRFTDDIKEHSAMINQMRPQRSTHLYDALIESFAILEPIPNRKALLVFSDGEDQGSQATREDALDAARRSHATVYSVGLLGWSAGSGMHTNQELLEDVAQLTGGGAFFPEEDKDIRKAFDRIRNELHHQYRMGYAPTREADAPSGEWREIQVELTRRKDLVVRSRLGYYSDRAPVP